MLEINFISVPVWLWRPTVFGYGGTLLAEDVYSALIGNILHGGLRPGGGFGKVYLCHLLRAGVGQHRNRAARLDAGDGGRVRAACATHGGEPHCPRGRF